MKAAGVQGGPSEALSEQVMADVFRISAYRAEFQRETVIVRGRTSDATAPLSLVAGRTGVAGQHDARR